MFSKVHVTHELCVNINFFLCTVRYLRFCDRLLNKK